MLAHRLEKGLKCPPPPIYSLNNFELQYKFYHFMTLVLVFNLILSFMIHRRSKRDSKSKKYKTLDTALVEEGKSSECKPKKPAKLSRDATVATIITSVSQINEEEGEQTDNEIPFVGLRMLLLFKIPRNSRMYCLAQVNLFILRWFPFAIAVALSSGYINTGYPPMVTVACMLLCWMYTAHVSHKVVSNLLRFHPSHVSEVLRPLIEKDKAEFKKWWANKERR